MDIGIDSFVSLIADPQAAHNPSPAERMANLLEEVEVADRSGLDAFGLGEHHREEFLDSAPVVILAAAAARTRNIRLHSAVTVLGAADPVRVMQAFATLDLLSNGRAEIVVGRGSSVEAFPLFGLDLAHYDELFIEKLHLLLQLRDDPHPHWTGQHRSALSGQGVYPRPLQPAMPIWLGVGGTPASFARAGTLGLPLMVAIIGGEVARFRPLVDLYRESGRRAGHSPSQLRVGVHAVGFVGPTTEAAKASFFPGWRAMWGRLGPERGWTSPTRAQFDALCSLRGAYLVGDPAIVAAKLLAVDEALGGVSRIHLQMSSAASNHEAMLMSIRLLGEAVAPQVRAAQRSTAVTAH